MTIASHDALVAVGLHHSYGDQPVLRGISLSFSAGEQVAITGASGSGKTTLLYCLSGLETPVRGTVGLLGEDLSALRPQESARLRLQSMGFVFQSADLVPELTLAQNIALPLELAGVPRRKVRARVCELIETVDLEGAADRRPRQVSGGQAQRAAVARAVVAGPKVIFADEPTGALDSHNRGVVLDLLRTSARAEGALLVMVTHDSAAAATLDRQVVLHDGAVQSDAPATAGLSR